MRERQRDRGDLSRGSRFAENLTCLGSWSSVVDAAKKLVVVEKRWSTIYLYPLLGCLPSFSCLLFAPFRFNAAFQRSIESLEKYICMYYRDQVLGYLTMTFHDDDLAIRTNAFIKYLRTVLQCDS